MKDIIPFNDRHEALSFYIEALSAGLHARWRGCGFIKEIPGETYYSIEIDIEKTLIERRGENGNRTT